MTEQSSLQKNKMGNTARAINKAYNSFLRNRGVIPAPDPVSSVVWNWYGSPLPLRIQTREENNAEFDSEYSLHSNFDHTARLLMLWRMCATDFVIRDSSGKLRMIQDLHFIDRYPSQQALLQAMAQTLEEAPEVHVVEHL